MIGLVSFASAAIDIVEDKVNVSVSYKDFRNGDQDYVQGVGQFTLKNNDLANSATLRLSYSGLPTGYRINSSDLTLLANETKTVSLSIDVPHKEDSGETTIGTLTATNLATGESTTAILTQETVSMLNMRELIVDYTDKNGDSQRDTFTDETTFELSKGVKPGTEISLTFKIENLFDNDYSNGDLSDITLNLNSDDEDIFPSDFEDEYDLEDLDAHARTDFKVSFMIDDEAPDQEYNLKWTLEAEDDESAKHTIDSGQDIVADVQRERDDLRIITSRLSPELITICDPQQFSLEVELKNYGTNNQHLSALSIHNEQLKINENIPEIDILKFSDSDNSWRQVFTFPAPTKAGTYPLDINAYINRDREEDHKIVNLIVKECAAPPQPILTVNTDTANNTPATPPPTSTTTVASNTVTGSNNVNNNVPNQPASSSSTADSTIIIKTVEVPYTIEDFITAGIIVLGVMVIALTIVFVVMLLK